MSAPRMPAAPAAVSRPSVHGRDAASPLPVVLAVVAVAVSLALAIVTAATASSPVAFFDIPLPLVASDRWWLSAVGYVLTPFAVVAMYGWDAVWQRGGLRRNPGRFATRRGYTVALLWLCGVAIVLGGWHALNLSVPLTEMFA